MAFIMGFAPDDSGNRPQIPRVTKPKGTGQLSCNEAVVISGGLVVPATAGNTALITGAVFSLRDSNGKTVDFLDTNDEGEVDVTYGQDIIYTISAEADQDVTAAVVEGDQNANLSAASVSDDFQYAQRTIDLSTIADYATSGGNQRQLLILGTPSPAGTNSTTGGLETGLGLGRQVRVRINPSNYLPTG
jgi:hypothetical protein